MNEMNPPPALDPTARSTISRILPIADGDFAGFTSSGCSSTVSSGTIRLLFYESRRMHEVCLWVGTENKGVILLNSQNIDWGFVESARKLIGDSKLEVR